MSTTVGTLTIEMAANIVRLQQDMDKARSSVENTMAKISKAAGAAGVALGALGVTVGAGAFASWIRGAIDAADETSKLAQKIGVAVPQVAGLQLAFRQSGIDAGALQTSMSKLSVAIAGGNDAFVAMNISTKNADGTLKGTRQILGEVADKFKDYEDGAGKTALAVQLFGKAGADLIPLLNGGSEALDEFDAMAKKLGLTLDEDTAKRAEKFNDTLDLMGQGFAGISRQVAAQLLPTLEGLADQFFSAMTEGDRLKKIGDALATGLKALYVVGIALVGVFEAVGDTIYAFGKQAVAVMKGDFAGAMKAGDDYAKDLKKNWTGSLDAIDKAWNANGSTAVSTMAATAAAFKKQAPVVNEETKKMAAESAKLDATYQKLIDSIENKTQVMIAEASGTGKLTEGQKLALKTMQDLQNGTLKLTDAQKRNLAATLELMLTTEDKIAVDKDLSETQRKAIELSNKFVDAQKKETASLVEGNSKLREQNDVLRLGEAAVRARESAVLRSTATDLEFAAATFEGNEELATQARLLRERADLLEQGTALKEAKAAAEEWKKTTDIIEQGLTDALMRGFESGKGFGENLKDTLINMFKTLVLRPILQPIAQGAASSILGSFGMSAAGSAATSAGGGLLGNLMAGGASLTAQGAAFGQGFSTAVSGMFTGGAEVASLGSATSGAFNVGASVAGAMPYVAAALVAANALGLMRSNKTVGGGITGTLGGELQEYDLNRRGGSLFNGPSYSAINMRVTATTEGINSAFEAIRDKSLAAAIALGSYNTGLETFTYKLSERLHPDLKEIGLVLDGLTEDQKQEKIRGVLMAAEEAMAAIIVGASGLQLAGETAIEALNRLMVIQTASEALNQFGGAFSTFATASVAARQGIIELAGGLDALIQKTQGFVANFYSKEEQAGITARGIVTALDQAGFTASQIAALETRADFRTLLESIDVSTDIGQQQFVALLDLQAAYSATVPIMEEQSATLLAIAEAAPQIEILQKMLETDAEYQGRVQTAEEMAQSTFNDMLLTMSQVDISINNLSAIMAGRLDRLSAEMAAVQAQANAAAANAISMANASAAAAIAAAESAAAAAIAAAVSGGDGGGTGGGGYASGGYMTGPALVGEHGPELFDPRTSQIYTAPATSNIFGGNEVAAEIRALRDEVSMMRFETRSTAVNTAKIARLQDNWDVRGLTVKTDADQPLDTVTV